MLDMEARLKHIKFMSSRQRFAVLILPRKFCEATLETGCIYQTSRRGGWENNYETVRAFSSIPSNRGFHCEEERGKKDEKKRNIKRKILMKTTGGSHLSRRKQASAIQSSLFNTRYETRTTSSRKITMLRPPFSSPFPFFPLLSFFPLHNQGSCNLHGSSPGNMGFGPHLPTYKDTLERCLYSYMCPTDH